MARPLPEEYGTFFERYVNYPSGENVTEVLIHSLTPLQEFYRGIPSDKAHYAYGSDKWTILQLVQHVVDTERIFAYRALCIARGEQQHLPGFDENEYAAHAPASNRKLEDLLEELILVRQTSISLFKHLSEEDISRKGIVSNHPISVNAIGFIIVGHAMHHQKILTERYLSAIAAGI